MSIVLTVLALVAGCSPLIPQLGAPTTVAPPPPDMSGVQGDRTLSMATRTGQRTARIHHPVTVGAGAPLVVVLHGETGSAAQAQADYGWDAVADREGFVVAYPDAEAQAWNAGPTCCFPHSAGVNDVGYLNQLVSDLTKADKVDRARVFAVGFSTGASMIYSWECSQPGLLAGIGLVGGALLIDCDIRPPVSVAAIHGTADTYFPLAGGIGPHSPKGLPPSRPLEATLALFRNVDKCPDQPGTTTGPPVAQRSWSCVAGRTVSAAVIDGAGHQWPGAAQAAAGAPGVRAAVDQPSTALNATDWLWSHLRDSRSR
ncbi:MAG TPA: PHB depolymerase family esterase [Pseudonocardia sp.]|jgi:polyhydroxybutyrate depolymerase|nr:PHB depolymerase family esterase [Pseudonocardia sp.]